MENTIYTAQKIADFYICLAIKEKAILANRKLQKLLYYAQVWSLVLNERPLFNDNIEAWMDGPVVPSIYNRYEKFGRDSITECSSKKIVEEIAKDESTHDVLMEVWNLYGKFDGDYLEVLSHSEDPWLNTRRRLDADESSNLEIDREAMQQYYYNKLREANRHYKY